MTCDTADVSNSTAIDDRRMTCWPGPIVGGVAVLLVLVAGCRPVASTEAAKSSPPPEVSVVAPVEREYSPFEEFTGRLEASEVIEIRARVGGYLDQVLFRDGADVKAGRPVGRHRSPHL